MRQEEALNAAYDSVVVAIAAQRATYNAAVAALAAADDAYKAAFVAYRAELTRINKEYPR